jgi:hypothetical protein
MERVGVRGRFRQLRLAERPPHPAHKGAPTSPGKRGEVKGAAPYTRVHREIFQLFRAAATATVPVPVRP